MSAIRIVLVLWGVLFLVLGWLMPPGDGDLWWQRWLGNVILTGHRLPRALGPETFTSAGAPWVPQEWLFSLAAAFTTAHGLFWLLSLLAIAIPIAILFSIYWRARDRAAAEAIAAALFFAGMALLGSFGVRAQVLGWGCFAAFLVLLDRRDKWYYAAVPMVAVWANIHASAMLAPVFLAARVVGAAGDGGWRGLAVNRDVRILPFVALALLCTPFGWHLPVYAVGLSVSPIRHYIVEWQPVTFADPGFLLGAFPMTLLIALGGLRAALRNKTEVLPIAMLFAAVLMARRNVPLFAIAAAPLAAASLQARFPNIGKLAPRIAGIEGFAMVTIFIACIVSGAALDLTRGHAPPSIPIAAIANLAAEGQPRRLLCEDFSACSLALQYPNVRVFLDGRCDPYPLTVWEAYVSMIRVLPPWRSTLRRYGVNAVVATRSGRLAKALAGDASWRQTYRDARYVLYTRT